MNGNMFAYDANGERRAFDIEAVRASIGFCILCGDPRVDVIGIFQPHSEIMRDAVLKLRQHPLRPRSSAWLGYGLCEHHANDENVADLVETQIVRLAERVHVQ